MDREEFERTIAKARTEDVRLPLYNQLREEVLTKRPKRG
jgi:hypothetical protein